MSLYPLTQFQSATLLKATLLNGCFSRFLNCTNGNKLRKTSKLFITFPISYFKENSEWIELLLVKFTLFHCTEK